MISLPLSSSSLSLSLIVSLYLWLSLPHLSVPSPLDIYTSALSLTYVSPPALPSSLSYLSLASPLPSHSGITHSLRFVPLHSPSSSSISKWIYYILIYSSSPIFLSTQATRRPSSRRARPSLASGQACKYVASFTTLAPLATRSDLNPSESRSQAMMARSCRGRKGG